MTTQSGPPGDEKSLGQLGVRSQRAGRAAWSARRSTSRRPRSPVARSSWASVPPWSPSGAVLALYLLAAGHRDWRSSCSTSGSTSGSPHSSSARSCCWSSRSSVLIGINRIKAGTRRPRRRLAIENVQNDIAAVKAGFQS